MESDMRGLEGVSKIYLPRKAQVAALDNVTVRIEKGQFVGLVGPSGSGKTTFLMMVGAMMRPTQGRLLLDGQDVYQSPLAELAALRLRKIGFVFQTFNLVPYLTALQNVMAPLMLAGQKSEDQVRRATELLERVGLGNRLDHKPGELSVGQQQRVSLARMMANDAPLILADEPTGNLDPQTADEALQFLHKLNAEQGKTIVMVTHSPEAAKKCPRILHCNEGRILDS